MQKFFLPREDFKKLGEKGLGQMSIWKKRGVRRVLEGVCRVLKLHLCDPEAEWHHPC